MAPALALAMVGCGGGGGAFVKAVPYKATVLPGSETSQVTLVVTRKNQTPGQSTDACVFNAPPDWCRATYPILSFDVQPSLTLYRVYVRNTGTNTATARVQIERDGGSPKKSDLVVLEPGEDRWIWELGIDTVKDRTK